MNKERLKEVLLYLLFGGATTCVSWGSYAAFVRMLEFDVAVGNALSWITAVLFAFVTNKQFVFKNRSWEPRILMSELLKFVVARLGTGVMEVVGVPMLVKVGFDYSILNVDGAWAKIIVSFVVVILNYVFSKKIVFR